MSTPLDEQYKAMENEIREAVAYLTATADNIRDLSAPEVVPWGYVSKFHGVYMVARRINTDAIVEGYGGGSHDRTD